jgi:hypothetical protein
LKTAQRKPYGAVPVLFRRGAARQFGQQHELQNLETGFGCDGLQQSIPQLARALRRNGNAPPGRICTPMTDTCCAVPIT